MRKLALFAFTFLWLGSSLAPLAHARAGGGSEGGGGGNKLIAEFVATANALLVQTKFVDAHRTLLTKTLAGVKFSTGPRLLDPITGKPIPNQEKLIAWGSPGRVQLKEKGVLFEASFEDAIHGTDPIAHIVAHELFRASGALDSSGKSIDENFQLSIGFYQLNRNPTRGFVKPVRSVQVLAAECKVTDCKLRGGWFEGDEELICRPHDGALNGYLGSTLQVFKSDGRIENEQHDGTISIVRPQSVERRLGTQELLNVRIADGEKAMQLIDDENNSLLGFYIPYSTRQAPVTTASFRISLPTENAPKLIDLTLGDCRTTIE